VFAVPSVLHNILFKLHHIQVLYIDVTSKVIILSAKCYQSLPVCSLHLHFQLTEQLVPLCILQRLSVHDESQAVTEHMPDYKVTYDLDSIIPGCGTLLLDNYIVMF